MIRLLTGANSFAIKQRIKELEKDFKSSQSGGDIIRAEASDLEASELNGMLSNASLFSQRSLVVLRNIDDNKNVVENLPEMLNNLAEDTDLILVSPKPDKRTRWYKEASKRGKVEEYGEMNEGQLVRWAVKRAEELGSGLSPADARFLVSRVGLNQAQINNELRKLAIYDKEITKENIEALVEKTLEESVFSLVDTVVKGRTKRAQAMYDELLLIDIDAYKFIGLMSWQLHNLLVVKANEEMPDGKLASQAGIAPFVVGKARRLGSSLSLMQIKKMISMTLRADVDIKQTRADSDSRVKLLIDEIGLLAAGRG